MLEDNPLAERGRSLEEDYFRKKDRELVERMRQAAAAQKAREVPPPEALQRRGGEAFVVIHGGASEDRGCGDRGLEAPQ